MHELSIAMNILEIAEENAKKLNAKIVHEIEIDIGELSGIDFDALEFALNILDAYKDVEVFNNFKGALQKISSELSCIKIENELQKPKIIFPEKSSFSKGLEWLSILVKFINERQVLNIKYQRFESEEKIHIVSPLILKEYENRWYLVAMNHKRNDVITFGLDRIIDVTVSSELYKTNKFNAIEYFNDFIGITKPINNNKVELIELEIENYQANFFKTKYLHHSQKIISETKTHTVFRFNLIINIELIKIIRGLGKDCKVLKPLSLKQLL